MEGIGVVDAFARQYPELSSMYEACEKHLEDMKVFFYMLNNMNAHEAKHLEQFIQSAELFAAFARNKRNYRADIDGGLVLPYLVYQHRTLSTWDARAQMGPLQTVCSMRALAQNFVDETDAWFTQMCHKRGFDGANIPCDSELDEDSYVRAVMRFARLGESDRIHADSTGDVQADLIQNEQMQVPHRSSDFIVDGRWSAAHDRDVGSGPCWTALRPLPWGPHVDLEELADAFDVPAYPSDEDSTFAANLRERCRNALRRFLCDR